jgi:hypothetical protein
MTRKTLKKVKSQKKSKSQLRKTRKVRKHNGGKNPKDAAKSSVVSLWKKLTHGTQNQGSISRRMKPGTGLSSFSTHPSNPNYLRPSEVMRLKEKAAKEGRRLK